MIFVFINQNRVQKLLPNLIESKASFQLKEKKKKVCLLFLHNKCSPNILFGWQIIVMIYKNYYFIFILSNVHCGVFMCMFLHTSILVQDRANRLAGAGFTRGCWTYQWLWATQQDSYKWPSSPLHVSMHF